MDQPTTAPGQTRKATIESHPARPVPLPVAPHGIPAALTERAQWVAWHYERRNGKWTKVPLNPNTGGRADATNSATWATFAQAFAFYLSRQPKLADGVGYVFSAADPFAGIDLDDCRDPVTGALADWAQADVTALNSYTDVSPSGTGVKVIVRAKLPPGGRKRKPYEMYDARRFFAMTGLPLPGAPTDVEDRQHALTDLHRRIFGPEKMPAQPPDPLPAASTCEPPELPDAEVIDRALVARNGEKFRRLWLGDTSAYGSHSEADLALCGHLAFWTGPDPPAIDRLFRSSGLYRKKWDRKDYRDRTIAKALNGRTDFYQGTTMFTDNATASDPQPSATWEPMHALDTNVLTPPFPLTCLPGWLRNWVGAEAQATQTPPDLAAMLAVAIIAAAVATKFRVSIRTGWSEPTNLYTVTSLPSGDRKSTVFHDATNPVNTYERQLRAKMAPVIAQAASHHRMLTERLKGLEKRAAKAEDPEHLKKLQAQAKQVAQELAKHHVPPTPKVFCDDETPESLAQLLATHAGRMLQASPEGTLFEIVKGRYSDTVNFDVYLKAHAGDPLKVGRVSRLGDDVQNPALSVALAVQPDVIHGLGEYATMLRRGLLARWLYSLPASRVGTRIIAPPPVPPVTAEAYRKNMLALWNHQAAVDKAGHPVPRFLSFSPAADTELRAFETWLEPHLRDGEQLSLLAGWASKLPGAIARLAGILHVAAAIDHGLDSDSTIQAATVANAITLGREYLLPHAQAAFGLMGTDAKVLFARRVLKWLTNSVNLVKFVKGGPPFTISQKAIHTGIGGATCNAVELARALALLVEWNYLRPVPPPPCSGAGRPPGPTYEVNPDLPSAVHSPPPTH